MGGRSGTGERGQDASEEERNRAEMFARRRVTMEVEGRRRETWQRRTAGGGAGDFGGTLEVALLLSLGR
jgi:hypothetical protein